MTAVRTRPYRATDRAACLALFDSNLPLYFAPSERAEFAGFLDGVDDASRVYLVLTRGSQLVACGGLGIDIRRRHASLDWGMVLHACHGQGLGTRLTQIRIRAARKRAGIDRLTLQTSQHTSGFYQKLGFVVTAVRPDGFAPGLDQVDMERPLR